MITENPRGFFWQAFRVLMRLQPWTLLLTGIIREELELVILRRFAHIIGLCKITFLVLENEPSHHSRHESVHLFLLVYKYDSSSLNSRYNCI